MAHNDVINGACVIETETIDLIIKKNTAFTMSQFIAYADKTAPDHRDLDWRDISDVDLLAQLRVDILARFFLPRVCK